MHSCLHDRMLVCKSARELKPRVTWYLPSTLDINLNTEHDTRIPNILRQLNEMHITSSILCHIYSQKTSFHRFSFLSFFFFKYKLLKKGKRKVKLETQGLISFAFRPWAISVSHNSYRKYWAHITRHSPQPCHVRANRHVNITHY